MPRTDIPWEIIHNEYVFDTTTSLRRLAKKHGLSPKSLERRCKLEGWVEERRIHSAEVWQDARARVHEAAVEDRVSLYDATREATQNIILALLQASKDAKSLHRHLVSFERSTGTGGERITEKWMEDREFGTVNGKNAADIARAIKDLTGLARIIDGIIDAPTRAKLDLERDKLELDRRRAGMSDDIKQESGIAYLPLVDEQLLEEAVPDPDQSSI